MNNLVISKNNIDKFMMLIWTFHFLAHTALRNVVPGVQRTSVTLLLISTAAYFVFIKFSDGFVITVANLPWFTIVYALFAAYLVYSRKYGIYHSSSTDVLMFTLRVNLPTILCMELYFSSKEKSKWLIRSFVLAMTIYAMVATITTPVANWGNAKNYGGITTINRNLASMIYIIAFAFCVYLISTEKKRLFYILCAIMLFAANLITGSRKGIIQAVAVLVIYFVLQESFKDKLKYVGYIAVAGIILAIIFMRIPWLQETFGERFLAIFDSSIEDSSVEYRALFRALAFQHFLLHPILGNGYCAFSIINSATTGLNVYCHSNYLELLCNHGLIGFGLYYLNYIVSYVISFKNRTDSLAKCVLYTSLPVLIIEYGQIDYYIAAGFFAAMMPLIVARNIKN